MTEYEKSRDCPKDVAVQLIEIIGVGLWFLELRWQDENRDFADPAVAMEIEHIRYVPKLVLGFSWKRLEEYLTYDRVRFVAEHRKIYVNSPMPGHEKIWNRLEALLDKFKQGQSPEEAGAINSGAASASAPSESFSITVSRGQSIDYGDWIRYVERANATLEVPKVDPTAREVLKAITDYCLEQDIMSKNVLDHAYLIAMNPDRWLLELSRPMSDYGIESGSQFTIASFFR